MASGTVYRKLSHILLISHFICPFFSLSNQSDMASDGNRRGYVSFAHFLLYFLIELHDGMAHFNRVEQIA